ncbi:DUF3332 domain-containing protein [Hyalangium rubrum]|uniref:DUF3332 domain-containing protein n=1 Tax=Hyalangium rubrum TaxID=3103134 RepID=A0ABU5HF33_9BACT|nr:DUF3332 domain-containing protein [Hyalangium sp. s54d21]MDY7231870.1 DUF3332 domain-containing protein [Hyalangium sp. s54d21]
MNRTFRLLMALSLTMMSLHVSACFGKFNLTRAMWDFNKNISGNKFVQWAVFLVMVIVPVYGVGVLVDSLVINSIEFWTGENPVSSVGGTDGNTRVVRVSPEETLRLSRVPGSDVMKVEVERAGQAPVVRYFEPLEDGMAVRDDSGALVIQARQQADGAVAVTDGTGATMAMHSSEAVAHARQMLLSDGPVGLAQYARHQGALSESVAELCTSPR